MLNEKLIFAIEKHRQEYNDIIRKIRNTIGEELFELNINGGNPDTIDLEKEILNNIITSIYISSFIAREYSTNTNNNEFIDNIARHISMIGIDHGKEYAQFMKNGAH